MKYNLSTADLLMLGVLTKGTFPYYYDKLLKNSEISPIQYLILQDLWDESVKIFQSSFKQGKLEVVRYGTTSSFLSNLEITTSPFKTAVKGIENLGLVRTLYRKQRLIGMSLSMAKVRHDFNQVVKVSRNGVSLFDFLYTVGVYNTKEVLSLGRKADKIISSNEIEMKNPVFTVYCGKALNIDRTPIFMNGGDRIMRQPIFGTREPIILNMRQAIFNRIPVILGTKVRKINFNAKKYQGLTDNQLKELMSVAHLGQKFVDTKLERFKDIQFAKFSDDELDCLDNFIPYYENLICKQLGIVSFNLLNNAQYKKRSRNWKSLWKTFLLCKERGWDYKVFLDSQFESFANWQQATTYKYPLPNMLYSERAIAAFEAYIYRNEISYQKEGYDIKARAKNVGTFAEEVEKKVWQDVKVIQRDISYWNQTSSEIFENVPSKSLLMAQKTKAIADHWQHDLSPEYLSAIPDIMDYIGDKSEYVSKVQLKIDQIESYQNNMSVVRKIYQIVKSIEQKAHLSSAVNLLELDEILGVTTEELW